MKFSSDDTMYKCQKMRAEGKRWKDIAEIINKDAEKATTSASLSALYSKWIRPQNVEKSELAIEHVIKEVDCKELVYMMTEAFKEVNISASFKMDTPKFFVETFKMMVDEIKLTRLAVEKLLEMGEKIEELDRDVRILLDNNMPLNRRGK